MAAVRIPWAAVRIPWAADLLHIWFHRLKPADWFGASDAIDTILAYRFEGALQAMRNRRIETFLTDADETLAAILLFDQIPRNIYRDAPQAFAFDGKAATLSRLALAKGLDGGLPKNRRQFVVMPLMHSEAVTDQRLSLSYFAAHLPNVLPFARSHYRMIARFGRFPHRNEILSRTSTERERQAVANGFNW